MSRLFFATLREAPKEADTAAHALMVRASMIRQVAAGLYEWLPLGWRVVRKAAGIVRAEMDRAGAQEVMLPHLHPRDLWEETGRWGQYGRELMRVRDRHDRDFALGPTAEEPITDLARAVARTYRRLPVTLYQIGAKFRDEIRPRFGVMRAREFLMKDAYSFDVDDSGAEKSYEAMRTAYNRIFTRLGLGYRMVDADSGLIGGSFSQEFMVLAETGEEVIATCGGCPYAANLEKAEPAAPPAGDAAGPPAPMRAVPTPGTKSIGALAKLLGRPTTELSKILFYQADGVLVAAMVRGDHEVNETKLKNALGARDLVMAKAEAIAAELGVPVGYIGPVGLKPVRIVVDRDLAAVATTVVGANRPDEHLVNVKPGRDFEVRETGQIRNVREGDPCPRCGGALKLIRGIEVGHIFKLGNKYSRAMRAVFLDESGKDREMVMGCYGIGVTRIVAAAIEQNHDANGIIWPAALAPYAAAILPLGGEPELMEAAERVYAACEAAGIEALLDDRADSPGVKFRDADLVGIPLQVLIGKTFKSSGELELKLRRGGPAVRAKPEVVVAEARRMLA